MPSSAPPDAGAAPPSRTSISRVLTPARRFVRRKSLLAAALFVVVSSGCSLVGLPGPGGLAVGKSTTGRASFVGVEHAGERTASGERYDPGALTAAHPSLPFGTRLRVTNLGNGRSVVVRVNDRGPYVRGRAIDVSLAAARSLGAIGEGVIRVRIERLR